jgi:hypothetical protein
MTPMTRRSYLEGVVFLYLVVVTAGAVLIGSGHGALLRVPWAIDETGIALVARRELQRNEIVRDADVTTPSSVPDILRRFKAPLSAGKYLASRHSKGDVLWTRELLDQPQYAAKAGHLYQSYTIDAATAAILRPRDRIEFRWHDDKKSRNKLVSCVEAVTTPPAPRVVYAVPAGNAFNIPTKFDQVIFYIRGRPCR